MVKVQLEMRRMVVASALVLSGAVCAFGGTPKPVSNVDDLVAAFESLADGDTIELAPGRYALTAPLTISKADVTVTGTGATCADVIVDGGGVTAGFVATKAGTLTINHLTITNCTTSESGGALNCTTKIRLTLRDVAVLGCSAGKNGGGVNIRGLTAFDCTFAGNTAGAQGGAIARKDDGYAVELSNCTFRANAALTTEANTGGGAVYSTTETRMTDCTFERNTSAYHAGAINGRLFGATNCTFRWNYAEMGGGVFSPQASNTIPDGGYRFKGCRFEGNSACGGAAIYDIRGGVYVDGCTFVTNVARSTVNSGAAAVSVPHGSTAPMVKDSVFIGNTALVANGGALYGDFLEVTNCTFTGNSAWRGGAWDRAYTGKTATENTERYVTDCHFTNNSTFCFADNNDKHNGGAVCFAALTTPYVFRRCTFDGNSCTNFTFPGTKKIDSEGGAVYSQVPLRMSDCTFTGNVVQKFGGAVTVAIPTSRPKGTNVFERCTFRGNSAAQPKIDKFGTWSTQSDLVARGGGLFINNINSATMDVHTEVRDCAFVGNYCGGAGGGAYFQCGGPLRLVRSTFVGNIHSNCYNSESWGGGAVIVYPRGQKAGWASSRECLIDCCAFSNNWCSGEGGGALRLVQVDSTGACLNGRISNCLFVGNRGDYTNANKTAVGGGGIYSSGSNVCLSVENCTFVRNEAKNKAGGLHLGSCVGMGVTNCLFHGNLIDSGKAAEREIVLADAKVAAHCLGPTDSSSLLADEAYHNVKTNDPQFVDYAGGNYSPDARSPAVNAGTNAVWMTGATDLRCNPRRGRIYDGRVDIGCYEFWRAPGLLLLVY